jgi:CCR4-NOT transcriptional regulation complex NOT5 subunit
MPAASTKRFMKNEWQDEVRKASPNRRVCSFVAANTRDTETLEKLEKLEKPEARFKDYSIVELMKLKQFFPSAAKKIDEMLAEREHLQFIRDSLEDLAYLNEQIRNPEFNAQITQEHGDGNYVACYRKKVQGASDDASQLRSDIASSCQIALNRVVIAFRGEYLY